jgi:hypothetical protein
MEMVLTLKTLKAIIAKIKYKDWKFVLQSKGDGFLIQPTFWGPDIKTGKLELQKCRKWYVSSHACLAEVVRTMYAAVESAEFHEFQERFKFNGEAIFSPHLNPKSLSDLIKSNGLGISVREGPKINIMDPDRLKFSCKRLRDCRNCGERTMHRMYTGKSISHKGMLAIVPHCGKCGYRGWVFRRKKFP